MGRLLKGQCVFVLKDSCSGRKERGIAPGILGMNVIGALKSFLSDFKGIKKLDRGTPQPGHASLHCILATMEEEEQCVGPNGWIGFVKVAGKQAVTIPPFSEKVIEGRCRIQPRTTCKVLVEASASASLPCGLLVANVLAQATEGKVPVRILLELSRPDVIIPREVVSVEEVNGEVYVSCGEVNSVEGDGPLSVPVHTNLKGLRSPRKPC